MATVNKAFKVKSGLVTPAVAATTEPLIIPHGTIAPTSPTPGSIWTTSTGMYVRIGSTTVGPLGSGGTSGATMSDTAPVSPTSGQFWVDTTTTKTYVYYQDGTSNQWIQVGGGAILATNLIGGNNTTLLGSIPYQSNTDTTTLLSPNTSTTRAFLGMTGSGTNGAAPSWTTSTGTGSVVLNNSPTFTGTITTGLTTAGYVTTTSGGVLGSVATIPNAGLTNSSITIGTTAIALGASSTTITGLTSLSVTGTATATTFSGSGASLTNIPNTALTNSSVTIGSTAVSLGSTVTTFAGVTLSAPTFTTSASVSGGALGTTLNATLTPLNVSATTSNVDALRNTLTRTTAGTDWTTAQWKIQRRVDATDMGYVAFGSTSVYDVRIGSGVTDIMTFAPTAVTSSVALSAPTATAGTNTTQVATTAFVQSAISGKVTGDGITNIVALTQAQYDALVTKSTTTLYVVT